VEEEEYEIVTTRELFLVITPSLLYYYD
jgi:hypothetical protein